MKILMILEHDYPPDIRVENEITSLAKKGHDVSILCATGNKDIATYESDNNIEIIRIYQSKLIYKLSALALLLPFYFIFWKGIIEKYIILYEPDVIHLHDLPLAKVVHNLSKKYKVHYVLDLHENRPEIMKYYSHTQTFLGKILISNKAWQKYQIKYTRRAEKLILVTPEAKDYYIKKYRVSGSKIYVVPNYTNIDKLKVTYICFDIMTLYPATFVVIYFGDTGLRRGTMTIIRAADILRDQKDIHFVIVGDSKEQPILEAEVNKRNLTNIELTGYLSSDKMMNYLIASDVSLCPFIRNVHHDTTYANKMFQSMYFSKPVIVSDCTAQKKIITKEKAGLVFASDNAVQLATKILILKRRTGLYNKMSSNAAETVRAKYNTDIGNKELLRLYESFK